MNAAIKHAPHYTIDDYSTWEGDWELWEGIAISMAPGPFGIHQGVVTDLTVALAIALRAKMCKAHVLTELDWIVSNDTVVRPDILVVCGQSPKRFCESTPAIVVEVLSDSTRQNDLGFKRELYQRKGVHAYLMIDPVLKTIQIDRLQRDGNYTTETAGNVFDLQFCVDCHISHIAQEIFRD